MKKSIFLFFAAILCAMNASAWSYKSAANSWKASTAGFTTVTMKSGKSVSVVMLKNVGDGVNICQNDDGGGQCLYCKWTKTSGDIFRGTARWNNGLYSDETVVVPGGKVYITVGSGTQVQMTAGTNYTYTADVTFSTTGQSYTISGGTVSGATIKNENSMPSGGKPASLTMKNSYTSKTTGNVHIEFDLKTNKVIETAASEPDPEPEPTVTLYFVNHPEWTNLKAHVWDNNNTPYKDWNNSESMTNTGLNKDGYAVYSYTFPSKYTNIIFKGDGQQTQDNVAAYDVAKPYFCDDKWYASLAEIPALGAVVTYDYYIAGPLAGGWNATQMGMEKAAEGQYTCEFTKDAGDYQFKVTNGKWGNETGGFDCADVEGSYEEVSNVDGNVNVKLTATTTFTVKFDSNTKKISFEGLTPLIKQNLKYTVTVPKGTTKCYLVGLGDWNNFREMTQDPGNNRIFTLTVNDVYVTDEYKYSASKNWNNAEVDVNNNDAGNRKWSESDVVAKWKGIDLVPEALTYTVTVPAGTEECYIAGTMNGWAFTAMEKSTTTPNTFTIDIANANEAHEYKYACKKNWDYAEVKADGSEVANRTWAESDVVEKWGFPTYTVAGDNRIVFGEEWAPAKADNDMVDQGDGTYKWTKSEIALKKNTQIKFKVVKNHDWEKGSWPGEEWVINTISKDGYYTITITFKESDKSITATATWTGEAPFKDFSNQPATLYFHPSFHWTSDNAEFAAYFYNEGFGADAEPKWADMTDSDGDGVYEVANAKQHEYVIICRMNPSRTENKWDENIKWNQISTGLSIPNTAGDLNTCLAFWTNCQGDVPNSECTWVAPTPLTDKNWSDFVAAYAGKTINAVVERSFKSGQLHTLCLPFDLAKSWLGNGAQAHQITSVVSRTAEELELKTTQCNTLFAGQPYIIQPIKGEEYEHIIVSNVTVEDVTASEYTVSGGGCKVTMQAVSATDGTQTNGTTEYYIGTNDGKLYKGVVDKLGLRALIVMKDTEGHPLSIRARVVVGENEATGIEDLFTTDAPVKVIENGQLIIIRDGEKFNAQGQKL